MKPKRKLMLGWNFLVPPAILCCMLIFTGCQTGKAAIERAAEKREKFVSDSIKYESVLEAVKKGEFVFKISKIDNQTVSATNNWMMFSNGRVRYQTDRNIGLAYSEIGDITDLSTIYDPKKRTLTITGGVKKIFQVFSITYFEGSEKAIGYWVSPANVYRVKRSVEGWIEPLNDANIFQGRESPFLR